MSENKPQTDEAAERAQFISSTVQNLIHGAIRLSGTVPNPKYYEPMLPLVASYVYALAEALWVEEKRVREGR